MLYDYTLLSIYVFTILITHCPHEQMYFIFRKPTFYIGSTLYANCYQQPADSMNPAHWMMKLGTMFEIATCAIHNTELGPMNNMFMSGGPGAADLPMKQLYLHQCPNPALTDWKW